MPDLTDAAIGGGGVGVGVALGVAALKFAQAWIEKRRSPEQRLGDAASAASDLIKLALEASGTSVQQLLTQQAELTDRLETVERSHKACEDRCESLTGELRQANQRIDSLLRQLRDPASLAPGGSLSGAVIELSDGGATVHPSPAQMAKAGS